MAAISFYHGTGGLRDSWSMADGRHTLVECKPRGKSSKEELDMVVHVGAEVRRAMDLVVGDAEGGMQARQESLICFDRHSIGLADESALGIIHGLPLIHNVEFLAKWPCERSAKL